MGRDNSDSQFFITAPNLSVGAGGVAPPRHLNYRHTIFGQLTQGFDLFGQLMSAPVDANSTPLDAIVVNTASIITNHQAGVLFLFAPTNAAGPASLTVQAQNSDGLSTQVTFQVTVVANTVNNPPFYDPMPASLVITQGMSISFPFLFWDDNDDDVNLNLFDADTGTGVTVVDAQLIAGQLTLEPVSGFFLDVQTCCFVYRTPMTTMVMVIVHLAGDTLMMFKKWTPNEFCLLPSILVLR